MPAVIDDGVAIGRGCVCVAYNEVIFIALQAGVFKPSPHCLIRVERIRFAVVMSMAGRTLLRARWKELSTMSIFYNFSVYGIWYHKRHVKYPTYSLAYLLTYVTRIKTLYGQRAFRASAPNTWNSLPADIQLACSLTVFKKRLKTVFFSAAFD